MAATVEEKAIPVVVKQGWIKKKGMQIFTYFFITQEIDIKEMLQTYIALNKKRVGKLYYLITTHFSKPTCLLEALE